MKQPLFAHLHSHTKYSLSDGSNRIWDYLDRVKEQGMESAAITDHGVMYGVVDFYKYAKEIGIHPVIRCEVYVTPQGMADRSSARRYHHLVLLAENNTVYRNLCRLVSEGFKTGFYYRPRIDFELLCRYREGLIVLSGCLAGEIPRMLAQGNYKNACGIAAKYLQAFGADHYYLELQDHGISVGLGRGSAAGSLVSYCLGITEIDPLKYDLLFERFLNPQRVTMPDIDIDFCYEMRHEVIDYVIKKYGKDNVAQIVTFGTLAARGVIRDVGRALGISPSTVARITKLLPDDAKITIDGALSSVTVSELKKLYEEDAGIQKLLDMAMKLEGLPRHTSTHAAGVVICPSPVTEYVPVCISNDGSISTQYIMTTLEELGLLKMNFLELRTLMVIKRPGWKRS